MKGRPYRKGNCTLRQATCTCRLLPGGLAPVLPRQLPFASGCQGSTGRLQRSSACPFPESCQARSACAATLPELPASCCLLDLRAPVPTYVPHPTRCCRPCQGLLPETFLPCLLDKLPPACYP